MLSDVSKLTDLTETIKSTLGGQRIDWKNKCQLRSVKDANNAIIQRRAQKNPKIFQSQLSKISKK